MTEARHAQLRNDQGFTLIEGMLASVILAVGLLALSGMQGIALVKNVDANELTRVSTLAAAVLATPSVILSRTAPEIAAPRLTTAQAITMIETARNC